MNKQFAPVIPWLFSSNMHCTCFVLRFIDAAVNVLYVATRIPFYPIKCRKKCSWSNRVVTEFQVSRVKLRLHGKLLVWQIHCWKVVLNVSNYVTQCYFCCVVLTSFRTRSPAVIDLIIKPPWLLKWYSKLENAHCSSVICVLGLHFKFRSCGPPGGIFFWKHWQGALRSFWYFFVATIVSPDLMWQLQEH